MAFKLERFLLFLCIIIRGPPTFQAVLQFSQKSPDKVTYLIFFCYDWGRDYHPLAERSWFLVATFPLDM